MSEQDIIQIAAEYESCEKSISTFRAFAPFLVLFIGFILGFPVFLVGIVSSIATILLAAMSLKKWESAMLKGVTKIVTPLVATIGFLFMSSIIKNVGLSGLLTDVIGPVVTDYPLLAMWIVACIAGLLTQSYAASSAVILPMFQVVTAADEDPLLTAIAAAGGASTMQHFLTGGPVAALATVIPVIPGADLRLANKFQRPSIVCGALMVLVVIFVLKTF